MVRVGDWGVAADLDGDGKLDTIVATANGQRVVGRIRADVQLSTSIEPFAIEFLAAESNISLHLRDVDGDNQPDLIFFGTDTNRTAAIWLNRCNDSQGAHGTSNKCDTVISLSALGSFGLSAPESSGSGQAARALHRHGRSTAQVLRNILT